MPDTFELRPIGLVESGLTDPAAAPKQGPEGAQDARLVLDPGIVEGLDGIRAHVRPLEAVDGTPVLDLKPVL